MKFAMPFVALFRVASGAVRWVGSRLRSLQHRSDAGVGENGAGTGLTVGDKPRDRRAAREAAASDPNQFEVTPFGRRRKKGRPGRSGSRSRRVAAR